jgi:hypothetical protein
MRTLLYMLDWYGSHRRAPETAGVAPGGAATAGAAAAD